MAAGYDGSIRIDTKINAAGMNAGTKRINAGLTGITASLKRMALAVGLAFGAAAVINFGKASIKAASDMKSALIGLKSIVDGQGKSYSAATSFLKDYISDGLVPATSAVTAYKNLLMRGYSTDQIEKVMTALKDSAAFGRQGSLSMGEAIAGATEGLKNENSVLVDNAGVTKNVSQMWADYAKTIGVGANSLTKAQKIQAEYLGIMEETRFQTGDAAKVSETYAGQIMKLQFNFNNLKIAVGNALIPMAQAVLPGINAMIEGFTRLANVFAQVSAAIFGKQAAQQEDVAKTADAGAKAEQKLASATKAAGKAAKGALAGFDELNVLTSGADTSSTSADDASTDISTPTVDTAGGELFGDVTVSPAVQAAVDQVKNTLGSIKAWYDANLAPAFETISSEIAPQIDKIRTTLVDAWTDIASLGSPIQKWFESDFTSFLQTTITTIGNSVSGLFGTFNTVFDDIWNIAIFPKFKKFSTDILPLLTQFSTQVVETFGTLVEEVKELFDMLWADAVAPALGKITMIWSDMWDSVTAAWERWGKPIFDGIREALQKTGDFLKLVWETILKPVWDTIMENVDWLWTKHLKPLWDNFQNFIGKFIDGALQIYNKFILPLVSWFVEKFGPPIANAIQTIISIFFTIVGAVSDVVSGVITSVGGIVDFIVGVFTGNWKKAWEGIKEIFSGVWQSISGIFKGIVNIIIDITNGMLRSVEKAINWIIGGINKAIEYVNGVIEGASSLLSKVGIMVSFSIPTVNPVDFGTIPKLATGAVIPPNAEFAAILGDQKSGRNIEAPESLIRQIVGEEFDKRQNSSAPITIILRATGTMGQMIRAIKPGLDTESRRAGVSFILQED